MAKKSFDSPQQARAAILDAAESIVVDVGPAGLRLSAVAREAGMAHPNIIHHFGSREGLLNALSERIGQRATERITQAITHALGANDTDLVDAMAKVLDTAYQGDEGRAAVWMHLSGAESSLKDNMAKIVDLSHQLRTSLDPSVSRDNTSRIVLLVTLALVGEVVSGPAIKHALGFTGDEHGDDPFKRWLAELLLKLSDAELPANPLIN